MADAPPVHEAYRDPEARSQAWRLMVPPLVFLAQFGLVYGWAGLGCAFGWQAIRWGPLGMIPTGVLLLTAVAVAALFLARPHKLPAVIPQQLAAYDPAERGQFMVRVTRMLAWLSAAGMLAVAAMALLPHPCAATP